MRALQTAFIQCGAVKKMWAVYVQTITGQATDPETRFLFDEIGRELVASMSDTAIKKMAALLAQVDGLTDRDQRQLNFIIRGR